MSDDLRRAFRRVEILLWGNAALIVDHRVPATFCATMVLVTAFGGIDRLGRWLRGEDRSRDPMADPEPTATP